MIRLEAENLGFVIDGHAIVREVSFAAQGGGWDSTTSNWESFG